MDSLREGGLWEWFDLAALWCLLKQGFFSIFPFSCRGCPLCGHNPAVNNSLVGLLLHQDHRNEWEGHPGSRQNIDPHLSLGTSLVAQMVKNLPAMQETQVQFLGQEDPLEKEMATHSSILAWRIPWTDKPGGLQSMGLQESDTTEQLNHHHLSLAAAAVEFTPKPVVVWSSLWNPMEGSTSGSPLLHRLPDFAQTCVHWVSDAIQTSHPLPPSSSLAFSLSQHQGLFQWISSLHQVAASASVFPMNIQGWFPLGLTGLISLLSKGLSSVLSSTTVQKHQFFSTQQKYLSW